MKNKTVFIITPIGKKGTDTYNKYLAICKDLIEPTLTNIDTDFKVVRADQIAKPGSFVKDILDQLRNSFIVIANLTGLNPNVFYELGVRHCLSARTIMITEDISTLPSDLKEYRCIEYSAEITGIAEFTTALKQAVEEIIQTPEIADNPVLDRIGDVFKTRELQLQSEIEVLNSKLSSKPSRFVRTIKRETVQRRIERILKLWNAQDANIYARNWIQKKNDEEESYTFNLPEGIFEQYFISDRPKKRNYCLIISKHNVPASIEEDLADVRVMISDYADSPSHIRVRFVIVIPDILADKDELAKAFLDNALKIADIKEPGKFLLEIWDSTNLESIEQALGIKL